MALLTTVSYETLRQMRHGDRSLILAKLSDPLFSQFCKRQINAIREMRDSLDLDKEKDLKTEKELRLLSQFWADLESHARDWIELSGETLDEGD